MKIQSFLSLALLLVVVLLGGIGCHSVPSMYPVGYVGPYGKKLPILLYRVTIVNNCAHTIMVQNDLGDRYPIAARSVGTVNINPVQGNNSWYEAVLHAQVGDNGRIITRSFSFDIPSYDSYGSSNVTSEQVRKWTIDEKSFERSSWWQ